MSEKYESLIGRFHLWKEWIREKWDAVRAEGGVANSLMGKSEEVREEIIKKMNHGDDQFDHLYRFINRLMLKCFFLLLL